MLRIRGNRIIRDYLVDPSKTMADLQEACEEETKGGRYNVQFRLRDLAANTIVRRGTSEPVGEAFIEECLNPMNPSVSLAEAMGAVDSTAFLNITGQLLISRVLSAYERPEFVLSRMIPNVPTRLSGEKIPGLTLPKDEGDKNFIHKEAEPLKYVDFSEEFVETPETVKRSIGIAVTKEALFFDRTGLMLQRAGGVGELLGLRKEKRLTDLVIGVTNNYQEKRLTDSAAVSLKTFYSAVDSGRWVNHFDGSKLEDWTDIDYAEVKFGDLTDPNTGEPIMLMGRTLLTGLSLAMTARRIVNATQVSHTVGSATETWSVNPLNGMGIQTVSSVMVDARLKATDGLAQTASVAGGYWFYGDFAKAFAYMENWPMQVVQAPLNSEAEFSQDIVVRYKATERGAPAVMDPRYVQRHRELATSSSSGA